MKHAPAQLSALALLIIGWSAGAAHAWDNEEHRVLADSALSAVLHACAVTDDSAGFKLMIGGDTVIISANAWTGETFGARTAFHAADDFASIRFHERGRTIMDQLAATPAGSSAAGAKPHNVAAAFLTEHLQALRLAAQAPHTDTDIGGILLWALEQEAKAQGYLADAFAAGHILSYREGLLTWLARRNRREAHDYHRDRGVYVINGRGEVWQTFGDGLLHWYPPTYQAVFDACAASLKEVLATWYLSHGASLPDSLANWLKAVAQERPASQTVAQWLSNASGVEYYGKFRMPSLMYLPMPVAAAWSERTDSLDQQGIRIRHYYPQLWEGGLLDPDSRELDADFMNARSSVPTWMIPEPLRNPSAKGADELIRSDPDWASVRYTQRRTAPPSYKGLLLSLGGQMTISEGVGRPGGSVGLGYGFFDDLLLVKHVSIAAAFMPSFHEADDRLLALTGGLGVDLPGNGWPQTVRLDGGLAIGLGEEFDDLGPVFALGLDSKVIPLGITYAGVRWRIQYQWFSLDRSVSGPVLTLIFQ
jgi:hypothetical protein